MAEPDPFGIILAGGRDDLARSWELFQNQPVDWDLSAEPPPPDPYQTTLGRSISITGPGTFFGKARRTLILSPAIEPGWWFERLDVPDDLPVRVSVRNVWTTARNIVLRSGSPHNYMRMVEHIIALRLGLGVDNLLVKADSGDPPLFDRSSMDLVEAVESAGITPQSKPALRLTVKEPVSIKGPNGSFLTLTPSCPGRPQLFMDCAIDFPNAIGRQRIRFFMTPDSFRHGAAARTNTTAAMKLYSQTVGRLFADTRNLGYTDRNILIAGKRRYLNPPLLFHNGKSLEAVWHRATLDLLAALALIEEGRFVGNVISYKAGHALDVQLIRALYRRRLLTPAE